MTGLDGKQGPPGNNSECILGTESESLIGMLINVYITTTCTLKLYYIIICTHYCILSGWIKGFNRSITTILCQVGSYRTVVG